ncbi:glycosyl transferase [Carboxydothermus islandicus]|uniref:Glycosyl transferase n=1 Tax=Carboxydothermus islandicus TaxID=661089 RepID=A0A1L8D4T4_9THEO|nr:glycosyltransferase [Carboxydothermus islandicus]GAV26216.1 glycosyl transferase [Carboxydothermus islandicus]
MKKILFILSNLNLGGAERVTLNLIRNLDKSKYEITLFIIENKGQLWDEIPENVKLVVGSNKFKRIRYSIFKIFKKLYMEAKNCDIIIGASEFIPTYFAYFISKLTKKPMIGWIHTLIDEQTKLMGRKELLFSKIIYRRIKNIVVPSNFAKESFIKWLKLSDKYNKQNIKVIYNIFDTQIYKKNINLDRYKKIFERPLLISIGRLEYSKGFDILIKAFSILVKKNYEYNLVILGEGSEREKLEKLAIENNLLNNYIFLPGFINNPLPFLKKSEIFILPSRYEGLGMVILEAFYTGTPVIAANNQSGVNELLKDNENGLLFQNEDVNDLVDKITLLIMNKDLRDNYKNRGKEVLNNFMYSKIVRHWEELFDRLMVTKKRK